MSFAGRAYVEMGVQGQAAFTRAFGEMQASLRRFGIVAAASFKQQALPTFRAQLLQAAAAARQLGGVTLSGFKGALGSMKSLMTSLIGQATALGAAFGLSVGIKDAIDNASRLEETLNKFNVVFGDLADSQRKWADSFAADMGRSRTEVMDFMSQAQSLIVPVGINQEQAAQMSTTLTQLSYDLASFHNATDPEAFEALRSALLGESEPMKRFGVIVNETAMKAELLKQGLDPTVATEAQKAMARYNIIITQTNQAQGDVERSSFSFANQLKALQASWIDLSTAIGTAFLPYATVLIDYLRQLISGLGLNATAANNTGKVFSLLGEATQYITKPLDLVIRGFNLLRGSLAFVVGMAATATDIFVGLFRLLANNPLTRGMFGEDFVRQVDTIAGAVQQAAKDAAEKNKEAMLQSFDIATQPGDLGDAALKKFSDKMNEMKAKFDAQVEAAKRAREEKLAEQDQITVEGGQQAADAIAGAFKTFSKEALAAYAAPVKPAEVQQTEQAVKEAGDRAVQLASPQALEATAVGTFEKFRENAMNQQIVLQKQQAAFLQQIVRVLKDPQTAIMEFTT